MQDIKPINLKWYGYLLFAVLVFAIFMFDAVSYYGLGTIAEKAQWSPLSKAVLGHTATILVWSVGSLLILLALKRKWGFDLFASKPSPSQRGIGLSILCVVAMTAALWLMNGGIKPLLEYQSAIRRLGSLGWIDFILQNIYYAFEMLVALLMCALGQEAGEILTSKKKIPWGGILLGILWGLPHIFSKNLMVGLMSIAIGILLGLPYLLLNKNAKLTWVFMFLMFVV